MKIKRDQTTTTSQGDVRRDMTVEGVDTEQAKAIGRASKVGKSGEVKFDRGGTIHHHDDGSTTITTTGKRR